MEQPGYAHHPLGHHREARAGYRRAIALYRDLGDRDGEADSLTGLGDTAHAACNAGAARDVWRQALTTLGDLSHPNTDGVRARLRDLAPK